MSEHYVRSILERLKFAKSYINWSKFPMEKSRINGQIKMCEHYLKQELRKCTLINLEVRFGFILEVFDRIYLNIPKLIAIIWPLISQF